MKVNVLFFGILSDMTKTNQLIIENCKDTDSLIEKIYSDFPDLKKIKFKIALNKSIVKNKVLLNDNDEIALLPPFAGG